jgi:hypothetical protein
MVKSSTKPDAWTLSPQMTASPNDWRDTKMCLPFWESPGPVGTVYDIRRNEFLSVNNADAQHNIIMTPGGPGFSTQSNDTNAGAISYNAQVLPVGNSGDEWSILIAGTFRETADPEQTLVGIDDSWLIRIEAGPTINLRTFGSGNSFSPPNWDVSKDEFHTLVMNWRAGVSVQMSWDGEDLGTISQSDTSSTSNVLDVGHRGAQDHIKTKTKVVLIEGSDKARSVADSNRLSADPFAMLRPAGF